MADTKNFGLSGIATSVELGPDGPRIKADGLAIAIRNSADTGYAQLKVGTPTTDDAAVTKGYLERTVNVVVSDQIDGTAPPAVVNGAIYICTTADVGYTEKYLYRGENSVWVEIAPFPGMKIAITQDLTGGNITFTGDTVYLWDDGTTNWINIGPYVPVVPTKLVKSERASLVFGTTSPLNVGALCPIDGRPFLAIVNVTVAFNGANPSLQIGDAVQTNRLMTTGEVNLKKIGIYVANCYHNYGTATQVIATYAASGSTAGQAQIEYVYSNA